VLKLYNKVKIKMGNRLARPKLLSYDGVLDEKDLEPTPDSTFLSSGSDSISSEEGEEEALVLENGEGCYPLFLSNIFKKSTLLSSDGSSGSLLTSVCLNPESDNDEDFPYGDSCASLNLTHTQNSFQYTKEEMNFPDGSEPTEDSSLELARKYWIVTTAAIPWFTGTAVNPLLRAAYLSQRNRDEFNLQKSVTLVIPWLIDPSDRVALYGEEWKDATPEKQEGYIRNWLAHQAGLPKEAYSETGGIDIQWYPAKYHPAMLSIFAMGDLCNLLPSQSKEYICILEEPEHCNFYRAPGQHSWRSQFGHVIGIAHTNYKAYAQQQQFIGVLAGPLIQALSSVMVSTYCDKVIKLSPVLQTYDSVKDVVCNVHGIRQDFFQVPFGGEKIYYIGKLLWAKGLDKLLALQEYWKKNTGEYFPIDIYGNGPEQEVIRQAFLGITADGDSSCQVVNDVISDTLFPRGDALPARFLGRVDHAALGEDYKIFVNPSITEVLCTTTAEAIAMGKWVIVPKHASNEFFLQFPNCLQYSSSQEFCSLLTHAMKHTPPYTTREQREDAYHCLSWHAATMRLVESGSLSKRDAKRRDRLLLDARDAKRQQIHYFVGGKDTRSGDFLRKVFMGGPVAEQTKFTSNSSLVSLVAKEIEVASC
jgi:hypothetical protein